MAKSASLGWLQQLDDDHGNAFIKSLWVKAVLPINPGRERDAMLYMQRAAVAGSDGIDRPCPYDATSDRPVL